MNVLVACEESQAVCLAFDFIIAFLFILSN